MQKDLGFLNFTNLDEESEETAYNPIVFWRQRKKVETL
jgi:hypothetical protein